MALSGWIDPTEPPDWPYQNAPSNAHTLPFMNAHAKMLKYKCSWNADLSFHALHNATLVNSYEEWESIRQTFTKPSLIQNINSVLTLYYIQSILKWLQNQKEHFRHSYLSYLFIIAFGRSVSKQLYIPFDIQNIILLYTNIIFIKFYTKWNDDTYKLRCFNGNFTFNNLMKILEYEHNAKRAEKMSFMRIWLRFGAIKHIYSLELNKHKIDIPSSAFDDKDDKRWVEVPSIYYLNTMNSIDKRLSFNQLLEIGIDIQNQSDNKFSFVSDEKQPLFSVKTRDYNRLAWLCSLKSGDIIDAYRNEHYSEHSFILCRDFDTFYVYGIDSRSVYGIKSVGYSLSNLQPLYSYNKCYSSTSMWQMQRTKGILHKCEWITNFRKEYGIHNNGSVLFEHLNLS